MEHLKATYNRIYAAWLPTSGYELAELDTLELYYPNPERSGFLLDIYLPIKLKIPAFLAEASFQYSKKSSIKEVFG